MSKITASARGQNCTVRLPGVCNFNPETTVFAHISGIRFGHGVAIKTEFGAYACSACHDMIDGRVNRPAGMSQDEARLAHFQGVIETLALMAEKGLVTL